MIPGKWSAKCRFFLSGEVTRSSPVLEIRGGGGGGGEPALSAWSKNKGGSPGTPGPSPGSATGSDSLRNKYLGLGE